MTARQQRWRKTWTGETKNNNSNGKRQSLCGLLYPLQFNNYLIPRLTQDKLGLWLLPVLSLTCPAGGASGSPHIWDCFELQPLRLHLWKYPLNGCLCSYCDTKCFKSSLSTILGNYKPVNNPVHLLWKNNSFKSVDMALSPLSCTEKEILPLHLFIIKTAELISRLSGWRCCSGTIIHSLAWFHLHRVYWPYTERIINI